MSIYNNRIRVSRRPVYLGYFLQSNGIITKDYFQAQQLIRSMHLVQNPGQVNAAGSETVQIPGDDPR